MTVTAVQVRNLLNVFDSMVRNNLVSAGMVTWNPHSAQMNDRNGLSVQVQKDPEFVVTKTTGGVVDLTSAYQSRAFGAETFNLNESYGVSFSASDFEELKTLNDMKRSRSLRNGAARMATVIDKAIMQVAVEAFPYSTGTWGQVIDDPDEFASARTRLAELSLESDMDLMAALTHADNQKLAKYLFNDNASLTALGPSALRKGFRGMLDGVPIKTSNQLGRITCGSRTNGTVAGASQNVNYTAASDAGANAGYYLSQNFNVAGLGAGGTVKKGEVFSITTGTAVNSYDADANHDRGFLQQFVVLEDATADTSGAATLRIWPAIIVGDGTTASGTAGINNAHRTVTAAPANGATVTWLGTASTEYIPRIMFRKDAVVVHTAPLIMPYSGRAYRRELADVPERDGTIPLMPRIWFDSTHATGDHFCRIDVVVQAQPADRGKGIKFFGTA